MQKSDVFKSDKQHAEMLKRKAGNYNEKFACWKCGKEIIVTIAEPIERLYCDKCYLQKQKEHRELLKQYVENKAKVMFETAMRVMEKSGALYMHEYFDECNKIYDLLMKSPKQYKSSYEIVIAIILLGHNYQFESNDFDAKIEIVSR
jgi:transcription elongation factor Elf1